MRSQMVLVSILAIAVSGCGKSVERNALTAGQSQQVQSGACVDPVGFPSAKEIQRFSDMKLRSGRYELVSFDGVGISNAGTQAAGISVVHGEVQNGGVLEVNNVCRELGSMPSGSYAWGTISPAIISATQGSISESLTFTQTVYGPAVLDSAGNPQAPNNSPSRQSPQGCGSVDQLIQGAGCEPAKFFQVDDHTIGVLRETQRSDASGAIIQAKIYAIYTLTDVDQPRPEPSSNPTEPTFPGYPGGTTGEIGENGNHGDGGNNGNNGNNGKPGQGTKSNNGNNGNKGNNGNNGKPGQGSVGQGTKPGQGTSVVVAPQPSVVTKPPVVVKPPVVINPPVVTKPPVIVSPPTTVVVRTAPVEGKLKASTKIKTDDSKAKSSLKIKNDDDESKLKSSTKIKDQDGKLKSDIKIKMKRA